ncbi:MAG: hypothetical protein AAF849_21345 [Bacteroidota bacterium]
MKWGNSQEIKKNDNYWGNLLLTFGHEGIEVLKNPNVKNLSHEMMGI